MSVILALVALIGCKDATIRTNQAPIARPGATPASGPAPLTVVFAASATDLDGTIVGYAWTFGDGATSSEVNPTHMYTASGDFSATVAVTDNDGAKTSAAVEVAVSVPPNRPPTATVAATPTSGNAPLAVTFTGNGVDADGTIASYSWMFGDGGSSTQQNPSHTYQTSGNFTATLTVTDNGGATGSGTVAITAGTNQPPTASASATPTSGNAPLAVTFTGRGTDADGTIASYAWSFGDGGTSNTPNPTHTYLTGGNFLATLTVRDNDGATGSSSVAISASTGGNQPPTAGASATPISGTAPLPVMFTGSGTDPDGTIVSYAWTFGDGGASSLQSPAHTYASAGSYVATLTVTDNNGTPGSSSVVITVSAVLNLPPITNAGPDQINRDPGITIQLDGTSSADPDGSITSYQWTQTAGGTVTLSGANTATPSFGAPPNTTATYTFTLTVTDNGSPPLSTQDSVTVTTRVTYVNTTKAMIDARPNQPSGTKLGCTQSGCHTTGGQSPPLVTYANVYANRSRTRSTIQTGGSMRRYLLTGEPEIITSWIDNGAPEKN